MVDRSTRACNRCAFGTNYGAARPLATFDGASRSGPRRMLVSRSGASAGTFVIWCLKPQALVLDAVFGDGFE